MRHVKTKNKRYTIKYKYKEPGTRDFLHNLAIYDDCTIISALSQLYEMLSGKEEIVIWDIEIETLYKRVD